MPLGHILSTSTDFGTTQRCRCWEVAPTEASGGDTELIQGKDFGDRLGRDQVILGRRKAILVAGVHRGEQTLCPVSLQIKSWIAILHRYIVQPPWCLESVPVPALKGGRTE